MRTLPLLGLLTLLAPPRSLPGQGVLIAPHAVFVDHRTRSATIELYNPSTDPTEVTVDALFGYPVTDSLGNLTLRTVDQPDSTAPSAVGWIRAYPRRLVMAPLTRQTVRLLLSPPPGTADGEYWARMVVSARGGAAPASAGGDTTGISVGLKLEIRTIIPLLYRKGQPATGVLASDLRAVADSDSVTVRVRLQRTGSAAFIGSIRGGLVDVAGKSAGTFDSPISVYYDIDPRFTIPRGTLPPGRYLLWVELASTRDDIAPEHLLPISIVRDSVTVQIR